ncbi:Clan SB, family S8, subtilisin-like serine peptidase [Histomonas meleagridis]|uniref:Clan SB, family S8, subtilisin-like serine peptidase n=1 Tax=Histomonas meleagridis TaxID=135588 RepID=UPI0035595337|nr:Clan SB, family S8, subtilisin-like serine peptidase [Histomonas meleagridis]KAH0799017.1 Clan SB, family S8, subtilisin-like serine peptidase [Histomonas meleagridis]
MTKENHGTHVAGTISGKAFDENSTISSYNGVAPESKLMYLGNIQNTTNIHLFNTSILDERLYEGKAISFSNSWGYEEALIYMGTVTGSHIDSLIYHNKSGQSCLFLYAAGNEGVTNPYYSINYPSAGKNVLSIAAAERIYGYLNFNISILADDKNISLHFLYGQPDTSIVQISNKIFLSDVNDFNATKGTEKLLYFGVKEFENYISIMPQVLQQIKKYTLPAIIFDIKEESVKKLSDVLITLQANFLFTYQDSVLLNYVGKEINVNTTYDKIIGLKDINKAGFSSVGPTLRGIIKPDIMAPGSNIYSANSSETIIKNHGSNQTDYQEHITVMSGTSMATPNAAGASALISQYLTDGHYLNQTVEINSFLLRSLLVLSASKNDGTSTPDCYIGHGAINISSILPFNDSDFGLRISKIHKMEIGQTHHIGYITVTSQTASLRIALSSVDIPLSLDSFIPIYYDLDLIVKSPTGKIYMGNNHTYDTEHLTLNEKVIIPKSEIEVGKYEIHVVTNLNIKDDKVRYVITAVGPFEQDNITANPIYIELNTTEECVSTHVDNSVRCELGRFVCSESYTGQLCKQYIQNLESFDNHTIITVPPNEIRYFKFSHIDDYDKMIIVTIALNGWNNISMIWNMGSPENYIPALANYNQYIPQINYPMFGQVSPFSYYQFAYNKTYPIVLSEEDQYFMIINNFAMQTDFLIYLVNEPYDGPLCFCDHSKCSNSRICQKQNTYNNINKLFGLVPYVNKTITYIDMDVRIPAIFLSFTNLSLHSLNGQKHTVELLNISDSRFFQSKMKLTAKDLTLILGAGEAETIKFEYLNLTNVNLIMNDYSLDVDKLVIDFEFYSEKINTNRLTLLDYIKVSTMEIYNHEILLKTSSGNSKKVKLLVGTQFVLQTSRPQESILTVVKGQKGDLQLPNGVNITIITTNSDGSNIIVDDSLKDVINIDNESISYKHFGLSNAALIGIIVGCVAFVIIVIAIIIIVIHNKKKNLIATS